MTAMEVGAVRFGIVIGGLLLASASRYRHLGSQSPCVFGEVWSCSFKVGTRRDLGVFMVAKEVGAVRFGIVIGDLFPASASRYRHLGSPSPCVFGEVCSCSLKVVIWSDLVVLMAAKEVGAVRFGIGIGGPFPASASRYRHLGSRSLCVLGEVCSCSVAFRCCVELVEPLPLLDLAVSPMCVVACFDASCLSRQSAPPPSPPLPLPSRGGEGRW